MKLNQSAFAKELSVDRSSVTLWKREGMPTDSRDAAVSWLATNRPKYVAQLASGLVEMGAGDAPAGGGGDISGLDLKSMLDRFRDIELRAWGYLDTALKARSESVGNSDKLAKLDAVIDRASRRYKDSAEDRLMIEKRVADFELETGRRVVVDEVHEWINEKFAGLKVLISALPHTEARNCNPADPETARRALQRAVDNVMRQQRDEDDLDG